VSSGLAFGVLLALAGVAGVVFGIYALLRGGRGQGGGIEPIPERGVHVVAAALSLAAGVYLIRNFS
jgi:hypothetical protein